MKKQIIIFATLALLILSSAVFASRPATDPDRTPVPTNISITKNVSIHNLPLITFTIVAYYSTDDGSTWTTWSGSSLSVPTTTSVIFKADYSYVQSNGLTVTADYALNSPSGNGFITTATKPYTLTSGSNISSSNYTVTFSAQIHEE